MKTKRIAAVILAAAVCVGAAAQNVNAIYKKYAAEKGVSAVYISPAMFEMVKSVPTVSVMDGNLELMEVIRSFTGMYILHFDGRNAQAKAGMKKDVEGYIARAKLELLMEAREDEENVRIFVTKKKDLITEFLMLVDDGGETTMIGITGALSEEALQKALVKIADD